jgi:aspartyl/asparaginyl-tRNA synthetase
MHSTLKLVKEQDKRNQQLKIKAKNNMDLSRYNPNSQFLLYKTDSGDVKVDVLLQNETVWMSQKKIAALFDVNVPAISKHLKNIFGSGELDEKVVVSILELTTPHGAIADKTQTTPRNFIISMLLSQ